MGLIGAFAVLIASIWIKKARGAYEFTPRDYSRYQKTWRNPDPKKYTTCRLKKRLTSKYTNKKGCIYEGGNKTFTLLIESWCPKKYKFVYDPNGTEPDIDKVMESLRSIKD